MELKDRIIRNLEWSNKRLKLIDKGLDEEQIEIIEFSLLHDLLQLNLTDVSSMFSAKQMEQAFNDGVEAEQQRCGEFNIENYH